MPVSLGAVQRRMMKRGGAPAQTGTPVGPSGGKSKLAPSNKKRAGSMFKPNPQAGKMTRKLQHLPRPR